MLKAAALVLLLSVAEDRTCNIPVFRYALERWPAAPYGVRVVHRGPLSDEVRAVLDVIRQSRANVDLDRINLAEELQPKERELLERLKIDAPCIVATYPGHPSAAWTGPMTVEAARRLVDSPVRRQIAKRILAGESAVWVLLECGDKAKDDEAEKVLHAELERQAAELKIPARAAGDPPLLSDVPVQVRFSLLRISRKDEEEAAFVSILLNSDTGLTGPVAFPIFGRGRALWAMAGEGFRPSIIGEAGMFLVGACSCEAKELNPGLDLLFAVDWESGLAAAPPAEPIPQPLLRPRPPEPPPAPEEKPASERKGSPPLLWGGVILAGIAVLITGRRLLRPTP